MKYDILKRPRRNRASAAIRALSTETTLSPSDLVVPFFIIEGKGVREPIESMPGIYRLSIDFLLKEVEHIHGQGIMSIALFPVINPLLRDENGSEGWNPHSLMYRAIQILKKEFPHLCLIADVALDPFTSHGHDGIIKNALIDNDLTLEALVKQALCYSEAGCDFLAPSDMMDGRVGVIRKAVDSHVGILSYTAKYASAFYSPFRNAIKTNLAFGDKKTYQMNPANRREAVREALLDEEEGADMLMVKPALPYLDVLREIRKNTLLPVGAYHVSGEYAMVMAAESKGYLNAEQTFYESLISIKRAGADFIFTYAASQILSQLS